MADTTEKLTYSRKECMEILGVGDATLQRLYTRDRNPLPSLRIGKKMFFPCDLFKQWLKDEAARNAQWTSPAQPLRRT